MTDLVVVDARILTGAGFEEAMAVRDGRVVLVGDEAEARSAVSAEARVVDLDGRVVLPGFVDAHVHLLDGGLEALECPLADEPDAAAILAKVAACAAAAPGRGWLVGSGWALTAFPSADPTADALDAVVPDRPVFLLAADGHSAWLNHRGLQEIGFDRDTADPPDGRIERGPDGAPSGTLRESAVDPAWDALPEPSRRERAEALRFAVSEAHALGVVGVFEAEAGPEALRTFRAAQRRGELDLRVSVGLPTDPDAGVRQVDRLVRWRRRFEGPDLTVSTAKIFADGVVEARTAALLSPYVGGTSAGEAIWSEPELVAVMQALVARGFGVHAHALGDAAVRQVLDAGEHTGASLALAHLELVHPDDLPRFAALGAWAVFQPLWAWRDPYVVDLTLPILEPEVGARLYPIGSALRAGAPLAFGSDWSVSSLDPWQGLEVAVTRLDPDGETGLPLGVGEDVSLDAAIAAYTSGAARAAGLTDNGRLEPGTNADFVVLDRDPWALPPAELGGVKVEQTWVGGREVWRRPPAP